MGEASFYLTVALICSVLLQHATPMAIGGRETNVVEDNVCNRLMQRIYFGHVAAEVSPDVTGLWTSSRCETRPGPEYIMRKYRFHNKTHFELVQFYYADEDCSSPIYSIKAKGKYSTTGKSWTIPGGTDVDYQLNKVVMVPYSKTFADIIGNQMNKTCPGFFPEWRPYGKYEIYSFVDLDDVDFEEYDNEDGYIVRDKDCLAPLDFSLHEMQLLRLEERAHHHHVEKVLYLGDIHTDKKMRHIYRPTSFQEPLKEAQTVGCAVCEMVATSDEMSPPVLHPRRKVEASLEGEWFSEECETRPNGLFLTRRMVFGENNATWEGFYYHYRDALCRDPTFTVYAEGSLVPGSKSMVIPKAFHYDLKVVQVKVTPLDTGIVNTMNYDTGIPCGPGDQWELGKEQEVTSTGGCANMNIKVPHVEYEIMKFEKDHHKLKLFLGQRPSDGSNPASPDDRPTSFQPALVKCGPGTKRITPTARYQNPNYGVESSGESMHGSRTLWILTLLTLFCSILRL